MIFTNELDHSVNSVIPYLEQKGQHFVRINTEELTNNNLEFNLSFYEGLASGYLQSKITRVNLQDIRSIWYRQARWHALTSAASAQYNFIRQEWKYSIWSFATSFPGYWVNHPLWADHLLEHNKFHQLKIAVSVGLAVPDTIISNSFDEIASFCENHKGIIACKPVHNQIIVEEGKSAKGIYTQVFFAKDLLNYKPNFEVSPLIVQEYIDKIVELRVTIIGHHIFSCEIHSQESERTKHDWRRYDFDNVRHLTHKLPARVEQQLIQFMHIAQLNFGAFDLILNHEGEYIFLEVNPNGQYGWVESLTKMPISQQLANCLMHPEVNGIINVEVHPIDKFYK